MDSLEGMCPTIAIRQRTPSRNPRSTVATATEIHDHLRVLFARVGRTLCPAAAPRSMRDTADSRQPTGCSGCRPARRCSSGFPLPGRRHAARRPGRTASGSGASAALLVGDEAVRARGSSRRRAAAHVEDRSWCWWTALASRRSASTARGFARDGLRRGRRARPCVQVAGGPRLRFSERFECARCARRLRGARAAAVLVQQPARRLRDLPRLREPDRDRPGPGRARQDAEPGRRRHRALEQAALPAPARRAEALRPAPRDPDGRALGGPARGAPAAGARGRRGVPGRASASSAGSRPRSTRSRCACSSAATAATRSARPAAGARLRPEALGSRSAGCNIDERLRA